MINQLSTLNLLLVEDEPTVQQYLKEILEYFFQHVYIADNGLEALHIMKTNPIHVIFSDYEMPKMNGYEFIKEVRSFNSKIPITIISNHDDKKKLQECIPLGLSGYIFKPITYNELKKYLEQFSHDIINAGILEHIFSSTHKLNISKSILCEGEKKYYLTQLEYKFLMIFIVLDGKVASFDLINDTLLEFDLTESAIKNLVYRLKTKYNFPYIKNIREVGYILVGNE